MGGGEDVIPCLGDHAGLHLELHILRRVVLGICVQVACIVIRGTNCLQDVITDIRAMPVTFPQSKLVLTSSGGGEWSEVSFKWWRWRWYSFGLRYVIVSQVLVCAVPVGGC